MGSVTFETATIQDVLKKAAKIAPSKAGHDFDKANGIVFELRPLDLEHMVTVKATNTDVFYLEWVDCVEITGTDENWRLPSQLLAAVIAGFPIGSGKQVKFTREENRVVITSARKVARMSLRGVDDYPEWEPYSEVGLEPVQEFTGRIAQVSWAGAKGKELMSGVHLSGELAIATDRYRIAKVPLKCPLEAPVTVPVDLLGSLFKVQSEVRIGVREGMLLVMPDERTQMKCRIFDDEYPKVERVMKRDKPGFLQCATEMLKESIAAMLALVKTERFPTLRVRVGNEEIHLIMKVEGVGEMEDTIELPGQCIHEPVEIMMSPRNLMDALSAIPNSEFTLGYDPNKYDAHLYIDGGSGYEAWVVPRRELSSTA